MGSVPTDAVLAVLKQLSHDIRDLDVGSGVDRHQKLPVVQFLRDYVAANKPVVLTSVVSHWPAFANWTDEYLCQLAGDTEVTVALTPNGRADAVTPLPPNGSSSGSSSSSCGGGLVNGAGPAAEGESGSGSCAGDDSAAQRPKRVFALPHQVKMPLKDFLLLLRSSKQAKPAGSGDSVAEPAVAQEQAAGASPAARPGVVPYLQYQNSSLTAEVPQLLGDVDLLLSWATQAFGGLPEAVNLWIGDERSVTSWHKDPFENIYAVVAGSKTFTLMPPADIFRMRLRQYASATYQPQGGEATSQEAVVSGTVPLSPVLHPSGEMVLWSSIPPAPDAKAAASAAATAAAAAPAGALAGAAAGGTAANGVRVAVPDPKDSNTADPFSAAAASEAGSEGSEQRLWEPDLFNDPQLPPPIRVTVKAGEALYLPAMWWHHVEQEPDEHGRAIAVNYWYDMKFDARQAYLQVTPAECSVGRDLGLLQAIERLAQLIGLNEEPPAPLEHAADAEHREGQLRPPYSNRAFG